MRIPHNKKIERDHHDFLDDLETSARGFLQAGRNDPDLRSIFKSCTSAFTVLQSFSAVTNSLLRASAGAARRVAALAMMRQISLANVELRRGIECALWYVYFIDHPVEWEEFQSHPDRDWATRVDAPIEAVARSSTGMFFRYAKERFTKDLSGVGQAAANTLHTEYGNLSQAAHAAMGAVHPSGSLALAFDRHDRSAVSALSRRTNTVLSAIVQVCAAIDRSLLSRLDAIDRAWFDWLIGSSNAKAIRSGNFGVSR